MADWPRRIDGHVVDRRVVFGSRGGVEHRHRCINCGVQLDDPTDHDLERRPCEVTSPGLSRSR